MTLLIALFFVLWHVSHTQGGGAIYNSGGALTFEGSATFTSCSAEASNSSASSSSSSSSSYYYYYDDSSSSSDAHASAVSGGE